MTIASSAGAVVNLEGSIVNAGAGLVLEGPGTFLLLGDISGGTIDMPGGAALTPAEAHLDGVTVDGQIDMSYPLSFLDVEDGLTLNGTATLEGLNAYIQFEGSQALNGDGTIAFVSGAPGDNSQIGLAVSENSTLTIAPGIDVQGRSGFIGNPPGTAPVNSNVIIEGVVAGDIAGGQVIIDTSSCTNTGTLEATGGGTLYVSSCVNSGNLEATSGGVLTIASYENLDGPTGGTVGVTVGAGSAVDIYGAPLTLDGLGYLNVEPGGTLSAYAGLLGDTTNADLYQPLGTVQVLGSGSVSNPQLLEVMSQDLGAVASGFSDNFAYGTLNTMGGYLQLVDDAHNSGGAAPEALYVNSLIVPTGSTLELRVRPNTSCSRPNSSDFRGLRTHSKWP